MKEIIITQEFIEKTMENQDLLDMTVEKKLFDEGPSSFISADFLSK